MNQSLFQCAKTMPWRAMPKISAPMAAPTAEPNPPVSRQPPITAAMMYWNSSPMPWLACTLREPQDVDRADEPCRRTRCP